ncbi:NADH-quinone oxidoreductase subunit NuoG [Candidatus Pelagibacter communis]|uniref:NADH-quinone oxidoreductase subunit NuoG n=1 Tax=Pelagibacter ubique TaxID=198252 RepID=UPI00094C7C7E|nr:NADH-quinone oxidoreductase subunit NuoG [Candidatus Pelagibacter ubique]
MPKIKVNNNELEVEDGLTVLQACEQAGAEIPRFCYHEKLSIAGNCRMCLVEIEKSPKPVASCAMPVADGMNIKTNTEFVEKARKGVMEFLLANHPLDCPVCDQGGECDLQDQSMFYGIDKSRFKENKRFVPEKYMGPLIKTQMTRCIHCTRCIRFATEVAGVSEIGAIGRGEDTQITTYLEKSMESELSGNVIDLCPVGALTSKPYVFEARPWELKKTESIDVMDAVGSNIRIDTYGWEVKRILPKINENINEEWISDKTRYACDGLKYQRLDTPYIRSNDSFKKISWQDAYQTLVKKIKATSSDKIGCFTGDLTNMETLFSVKELFYKVLNCKNLESRSEKTYVNISSRTNYIFNTQISNIEKSDFILLIGTNPRHEATILNSRIRKSFLKNNTEIYSLNDVGNLTYPYKVLENDTDELKKIILNEHRISKKIISAKNPIIIFGQSSLKLNSSGYIFEGMKKFLSENDKINKDWNALNILSNNSSTVGAYDLGILDNETIDKALTNQFEVIFLFGQDNLNFKKKNEFIVYVGTHGDRGAEIADLILPSAAYTEQNGYYTNLEGNLQLAFKASYPPGEAKEDWEIVNEISKRIKGKSLYSSKQELIDNFLNHLSQKTKKNNDLIQNNFKKEKIFVDKIDYYFTNVIARSSKTMAECRNLKIASLKTGTDG